MHEVIPPTFSDADAAEREFARTKAEIDMVNWLRAQARDRSPDGVRGRARWYVVAVKNGREVAMAIRLLKMRIRAFCPRERAVEKLPRCQGRRIVRRIICDGYIFVQLAPWEASWAGVLTFDGVQKLLPNNLNPLPVSEKAIEELQRLNRAKPHKSKGQMTLYDAGDEVRIKVGPFTDFIGLAQGPESEGGRLKVNVSIFGRETPCEVWLDQIQKLR